MILSHYSSSPKSGILHIKQLPCYTSFPYFSNAYQSTGIIRHMCQYFGIDLVVLTKSNLVAGQNYSINFQILSQLELIKPPKQKSSLSFLLQLDLLELLLRPILHILQKVSVKSSIIPQGQSLQFSRATIQFTYSAFTEHFNIPRPVNPSLCPDSMTINLAARLSSYTLLLLYHSHLVPGEIHQNEIQILNRHKNGNIMPQGPKNSELRFQLIAIYETILPDLRQKTNLEKI